MYCKTMLLLTPAYYLRMEREQTLILALNIRRERNTGSLTFLPMSHTCHVRTIRLHGYLLFPWFLNSIEIVISNAFVNLLCVFSVLWSLAKFSDCLGNILTFFVCFDVNTMLSRTLTIY